MKIYLVGGAVRDKLLGSPIKERDYVVVGATVDDMLKLGFKQVGKEFPVFLHPKTAEEYALARAERKVKPGYKGFEFDTSSDVTLKEDLKRRDLTINAMAQDLETAEVIDYFSGREDIALKILRHVSPAFVEDPVRILRIGRFLARFSHLGFKVAAETTALMQKMVKAGEVDALVAERVFKELERALHEPHPEQFFEVLASCHALPILFPGLDMAGIGMQALIEATQLTTIGPVRFAALLHAPIKGDDTIPFLNQYYFSRYRMPSKYRQLTVLSILHAETALKAKNATAGALLDLFTALDIFRRGERFNHFLLVCQAIAHARKIDFDAHWLQFCAEIVKTVDVQNLLSQGFKEKALAAKLKEEREKKLMMWLAKEKN